MSRRTVIEQQRSPDGFTVVEALIVLCIVAVLLTIAIPKYAQINRYAQYEKACQAAGGTYFRARGSTPLCLRRDLLIPVTDTVRP